jgi:hypothetical protein
LDQPLEETSLFIAFDRLQELEQCGRRQFMDTEG